MDRKILFLMKRNVVDRDEGVRGGPKDGPTSLYHPDPLDTEFSSNK